MKLNKVKVVVADWNTAAVPVQKNENYCKYCGKPLLFVKGKKKKQFCNDKCRMKWWNHQKQLEISKCPGHKVMGICKYCGERFTYNSNQPRKYCSRLCYYLDTHKKGL